MQNYNCNLNSALQSSSPFWLPERINFFFLGLRRYELPRPSSHYPTVEHLQVQIFPYKFKCTVNYISCAVCEKVEYLNCLH